MSFPRYPAYKPSGVEWLGEVPEHWDVLPCRAIVDERTEKNEGAACQDYLSLMANIGIIPYEEKGDIGNKKPEDLSKCKIVKKGDFVINSMNYGIGSYGASDCDGVCSPVYVVLITKVAVVEPGFAFRIFEDKRFQGLAQSFGNGILAHRCAIGWDILKVIGVAVPPRPEQKQILEFLNRETAKIDALIAEQQRLIELLQEKRQAVISHAVTKGLNLDAPMKDSGVEWLGEVPEHWEVKQVRHLLKSLTQGSSPNCLPDPAEGDEYGVLKVGCVNGIGFLPTENKALPPESQPDLSSLIRQGDVLMSRGNTRELVGLAALVTEAFGRLMASDLIFVLRVIPKKIHPGFLACSLRSRHARSQLEPKTVGTSASMQKINQSTIKEIFLPIPPLAEQTLILEKIQEEVQQAEENIGNSREAIALLKERRSALISAAVTGQIDVRGKVPEAA